MKSANHPLSLLLKYYLLNINWSYLLRNNTKALTPAHVYVWIVNYGKLYYGGITITDELIGLAITCSIIMKRLLRDTIVSSDFFYWFKS